jgi:hypothetical protein
MTKNKWNNDLMKLITNSNVFLQMDDNLSNKMLGCTEAYTIVTIHSMGNNKLIEENNMMRNMDIYKKNIALKLDNICSNSLEKFILLITLLINLQFNHQTIQEYRLLYFQYFLNYLNNLSLKIIEKTGF